MGTAPVMTCGSCHDTWLLSAISPAPQPRCSWAACSFCCQSKQAHVCVTLQPRTWSGADAEFIPMLLVLVKQWNKSSLQSFSGQVTAVEDGNARSVVGALISLWSPTLHQNGCFAEALQFGRCLIWWVRFVFDVGEEALTPPESLPGLAPFATLTERFSRAPWQSSSSCLGREQPDCDVLV